MLYERVVSIVFVSELSARLPKTECHSFICANAGTARGLALSLRLAFDHLVERLKGKTVPLALQLQQLSLSEEQNESRDGDEHDADA